jgi:hypothetical protein
MLLNYDTNTKLHILYTCKLFFNENKERVY